MADGERDATGPGRTPGGGWVPVPDPTTLTTEAVERATQVFRREIQALQDLLDARLEGMDRDRVALRTFTDDVVRRFTGALADFRAEVEHRDRANRELIEQRLGDLDNARQGGYDDLARRFVAEREYIESRIGSLRDTLEQRLGGMDIATRVLATSVEKFPTDIDRSAGSTRDILRGEIARVGDVTAEKFAAVDALFASNALALAAALAAQEKAVAAQNNSNTLAIRKSEDSTKETIAANLLTAQTGLSSLANQVSDIKDRVVRIESTGAGAAGQRGDQRASIGTVIAAVATLVAVISFVLVIIKKLRWRPAMDAARRWFAVHRKLITFLAGAVLTICIQVFGTDNPYVSLGILAATGLGIYGVPNQATPAAPPVRAEKTLIPPAAPE